MIRQIISGGQTGADMGGLLASELIGIPRGGYCPDGYVDENEMGYEKDAVIDGIKHAISLIDGTH